MLVTCSQLVKAVQWLSSGDHNNGVSLAMPLLAFFSKWPACHQMRIFGWTGSLPWLQPFVPTWCAGGKCQLFLANVSLADIETVIEHPFGMPHQINLGFGSKAGGKMCATLSWRVRKCIDWEQGDFGKIISGSNCAIGQIYTRNGSLLGKRPRRPTDSGNWNHHLPVLPRNNPPATARSLWHSWKQR